MESPQTLQSSAIESWVDSHGDSLFRYAMAHVKDRDVAEDLVQDTFLAALQSSQQFQGRSQVVTWLIGILRNKLGTYWRKAGRERPATDLADDAQVDGMFFDTHRHWKRHIPPVAVDPNQEMERRELMTILSECVAQLPAPLAEVFSLRDLEGLRTRDICQCLQITASNLSVRLHRARLLLRRCLERKWLKN